MILSLRNINKKLTQNKYIKYSIILILISILNFSFINFFSIFNVTPDIFLIFVVWAAIKEGRLFGILAGFVIGLYLDFISGDIMGTNALTKTISGFIAAGFHKKDATRQIVNEWKFVFVVFICAVVHNLIYSLFFIEISRHNYMLSYLRFGFASSFYTAFLSIFVYLYQLRPKSKYYS
ncbi:MAG: rod shape-determining protein MreD [Bacteroidetes bacterium]|nr:rod shape-determining protein MreD [Bacteroidota bacterium]